MYFILQYKMGLHFNVKNPIQLQFNVKKPIQKHISTYVTLLLDKIIGILEQGKPQHCCEKLVQLFKL